MSLQGYGDKSMLFKSVPEKNAGLKGTLETTHLILTAQAHHVLSHLPDADE